MDSIHLFYSWQSDRDRQVCSDFVQTALDMAKERLEEQYDVRLQVDRDTKGIPGTPPVTETILEKIRECDIFVADMSFVGRADSPEGAGKQLPNPNVMVEYGYARHALGDRRILLVFNAAFGSFKELPFDLATMRRPTEYKAEPGIKDGPRRAERSALAARLVDHLGEIIKGVLAERALPAPVNQEAIARANENLANLDAHAKRHVPAIVSRPFLRVRLVPFDLEDERPYDLAQVKALRPRFVPAGFASERRDDTISARMFTSTDPSRPVAGSPNPEVRWYTRILRPGLFEIAVTIGERVADDPMIVVDGHQLEARIIDAATRLASLASMLGFMNRALVSASLHGMDDVEIVAGRRVCRMLGPPDHHIHTMQITSLALTDPMELRPILDALWLDFGIDDGSPSYSSGRWAGEGGQGVYNLD
jgi:hypothetical protein